ncbi:MAG: hypothetical protein AAFT19_09605, partial [Pseudomonadota bacterium]
MSERNSLVSSAAMPSWADREGKIWGDDQEQNQHQHQFQKQGSHNENFNENINESVGEGFGDAESDADADADADADSGAHANGTGNGNADAEADSGSNSHSSSNSDSNSSADTTSSSDSYGEGVATSDTDVDVDVDLDFGYDGIPTDNDVNDFDIYGKAQVDDIVAAGGDIDYNPGNDVDLEDILGSALNGMGNDTGIVTAQSNNLEDNDYLKDAKVSNDGHFKAGGHAQGGHAYAEEGIDAESDGG